MRATQTVAGTVDEVERRWFDTARWESWVDGLERVVDVTGPWPDPGAVVHDERAVLYDRLAERCTRDEKDAGRFGRPQHDAVRGRVGGEDPHAPCGDRNRAEAKAREFEEALHEELSPVRTGGPYDGWDLELRGGILGGQRILVATEDLGSGGQLVRVRSWPVFPLPAMALVCLLAALAAGAAWDHAWFAMALLAVSGLGITLRAVWESGTVGSLVERALKTEMPQTEKCHKEAAL